MTPRRFFNGLRSQIIYPLAKESNWWLWKSKDLQVWLQHTSTTAPQHLPHTGEQGNPHPCWSHKGPTEGLRAPQCQVSLPSPKCSTYCKTEQIHEKQAWGEDHRRMITMFFPAHLKFSSYIRKLCQWSSSCISAPNLFFCRTECLQKHLHMQSSASGICKQAVPWFLCQLCGFCGCTLTMACLDCGCL